MNHPPLLQFTTWLGFFLLLGYGGQNIAQAAQMQDYCVSPAFVAQPIAPNIMVVLDTSGSMCGQAYGGDYDPSRFQNGLYYGYFDGAKNYQYTNNGRWEVTTQAISTGTKENPIATGSFLNWATMRRTEVAKRLLIGGKASPRSHSGDQTVKLLGESGNCYDLSFSKTWDTSDKNVIYPFIGNFSFYRDTSDKLTITPVTDKPNIYNVFPNNDIQLGGWLSKSTTSPDATSQVKDANGSDQDNTYILNTKSKEPVLLEYDGNSLNNINNGDIKVNIIVNARINENYTKRIHAVIRINGTNYLSPYSTVDSYAYKNYTFTWAKNPATNLPWTIDEIKKIASSNNIDGFGVQSYSDYNQRTLLLSRIYIQINTQMPSGGPYNIIVDQGTTAARGLFDTLDSDVRFGLAYYNYDEGGRIETYVGYNTATANSNMINSVSNIMPNGWTPLGETLYEMVRYFRQDNPYYYFQDYSPGQGSIGATNIFRDPYAYKMTDVDSRFTDSYAPCAKSFVLFLTDGESTQDTNVPYPIPGSSKEGGLLSTDPDIRFAGTQIGARYDGVGRDYMIDVAYWARTKDMRPGAETDTPTSWRQSLPGMQNIYLYPIFMFGTGSSLLKDAAIYGGFDDLNDNNKPDCLTIPEECYKDSNGDGLVKNDGTDLPLTYYEGSDGYALERNIKEAIYDIMKRAASSTAVSVLSSSEGSGANLLQSLFYPKRSFANSDSISWTSDLMNYWYYFDPYFKNSQIREDTIRDDSDYSLLDLKKDYITVFRFDAGRQETLAIRCQDTDGDGDCDTNIGSIPIEDSKAIWRAGLNLWWTEPANRSIKTSIDGSSLVDFSVSNSADLDDYLGLSASQAASKAIINYVLGMDSMQVCVNSKIPCSADADCASGDTCGAQATSKLCRDSRIPCYVDTDCGLTEACVENRNRIAPIKVCSASKTPCKTNTDCPSSAETCAQEKHTWKLGDIISSTPRIMGPSPLNNYNLPAPTGYRDVSYRDFITQDAYKQREQVFVGANDGMFHAFKLGKILQRWEGKEWWQPGKIEGSLGKKDATTSSVGTESWAYIPKNVLPYLQHLSKPDYCHIYMTDGPVSLVDASIYSETNLKCEDLHLPYWQCPKDYRSWRSIVMGSMGIGGATGTATDGACVSTPLKVRDATVGWSSYFALDVTDQNNPKLLWEFPNVKAGDTAPKLGVTNVGPAIVKVGREKRCAATAATCSSGTDCAEGDQCIQSNGRWFAILASGSTGPIQATEFKGTSNQNLYLYVVDLKTGKLERTIDTGLTNAFAGSLANNVLDVEKNDISHPGNYQDDVVYIGYVQNQTNGGILRLTLNDEIDPSKWTITKLIDNIGPITASISTSIDRRAKKLWLFFAEGRYFYKQDDKTNQRKLFGVQDPCYKNDTLTPGAGYQVLPDCTELPVTLTELKDSTTVTANVPSATAKGWYIKLDAASGTMGAERVISNPTLDPLGAVYYLSFKPTSDICSYGGNSYLWAVDYKTGYKVIYLMQGKALVQVSTGEIKELDLGSSTTFVEKDNRRSAGFSGIPPTGQGLMVTTNPLPIKQFMHVQEE